MRVELRGFAIDLAPDEIADLRAQLDGQPVSVTGEELVDAATLARRLGVSRDYVYAHRKELGGEPLGTSTPAPALPRQSAPPGNRRGATDPRTRPRTPRLRKGASVELLAVRGSAPYADRQRKAAPGSASTPTEGLDTGGGCSYARE